MLRRSATGRSPAAARPGRWAPWTPPPTRCGPGREYQRRSFGQSWPARVLTSRIILVPVSPSAVAKRSELVSRSRDRSGHSLARAASWPPSRCAISKRSHRPRGEDTGAGRRRPIAICGAAAERDCLPASPERARCPMPAARCPCMNENDPRARS